MEDFGYKKTNEPERNPLFAKKIFLISATLLSLSAFIYISINAYYFINQGNLNKEIETIKGPDAPIKVYEGGDYNDKNNERIVNRSIYDDIFGNRKDASKEEIKINKNQEPAYPPSNYKNPIIENNIKENFDDTENLVKKIDEISNEKIEKTLDYNKKVAEEERIEKVKETPKAIEVVVKTQPAPRKRSGIRVQISAMSSKENCEEYWKKISRLHPEIFSGTKYFIEEVNLGRRGVFFRLQIGEFFNQIDAEEFCTRFVSKAQKTRSDCIVVE